MRYITIVFIVFFISSCGTRDRKNEEQLDDSRRQEYLQKGGEIASLTQAELLLNVASAMKKGGPGYAVDFCNIRALSIKDSLSDMNNCQIRRIALKYRNPVGKPQTKSEIEQLNHYQLAFERGETMKPELIIFKDRIEYYQPIMLMMEACLKCHGTPGKHIDEETLRIIQSNYPDDLATGFGLNDFRGAWQITFPNPTQIQ